MLREVQMNSYGQKIVDQVDGLVASSSRFPVAVYIEGGDYDLGAGIGGFALNSLQMALDLANNIIFRYRKKVKVILGAFINDLGCKDKSNGGRPELLAGFDPVTAGSPVYKKELFVVSFETNAKNRGVKTLKKLMALPGKSVTLVPEPQEQGQHIFFCEQRSRVLLAEVAQDRWAVKCPMLMAQHYLDVVALMNKRVPNAETYALIDFSEKIDSNKVENGALIATRLLRGSRAAGKHIVISNHFFWDDTGAMISGSMREFRQEQELVTV